MKTWSEVAGSEGFKALDQTQQEEARNQYFDRVVSPRAPKDALEEVRRQFDAATAPTIKQSDNPIPGAVGDESKYSLNKAPAIAEEPVNEGASFGGMHIRKAAPLVEAKKPSILGDSKLTPEQLKEPTLPDASSNVRRVYDASTPAQRAELVKKYPELKTIDDVYNKYDQSVAANKSLTGNPYQLDTRLEKRTSALQSQGLAPEFAASTAKRMALDGSDSNQSPWGSAQAADKYYDIEKANRITPEMGDLETGYMIAKRGLTKAGITALQGGGGVNKFIGDTLGVDTSDTDKTLNSLNQYSKAVGNPSNHAAQLFEGAVTSIVQNLPGMAAGVATGSSIPVLASMFVSQFGQTYDESRREGLSYTDSTIRSGLYATAETIFEKYGLGNRLDLLKDQFKHIPAKDLPAAMSKFMHEYLVNVATKEVPGELSTYASEFAVDKAYNMNTQAGIKDFLQGAVDTIAVTFIQGGMMAGGSVAISEGINHIPGSQTTESKAADISTAKQMLEDKGFKFDPSKSWKPSVTQLELVDHAQSKLDALNANPDPAKKAEHDFLSQNIDKPEVLANAYGVNIKNETPATAAETPSTNAAVNTPAIPENTPPIETESKTDSAASKLLGIRPLAQTQDPILADLSAIGAAKTTDEAIAAAEHIANSPDSSNLVKNTDQIAESIFQVKPVEAAPAAPANPVNHPAYINTDKAKQAIGAAVLPGMKEGDIVTNKGIAFKDKAKAAIVKKEAGKGWVIKKVGAGYVVRHQPATDAQIAAGKARARANSSVDLSKDSMLTAIAKSGGINTDELVKTWGASLDDMKSVSLGAGLKRAHKSSGMSADKMAELMAELGYIGVDEHGKHDLNEMMDHFFNELQGEPHYAPEGFENVAKQAQNDAYDEWMHEKSLEEARQAADAQKLSEQAQELITDLVGEFQETAKVDYEELNEELKQWEQSSYEQANLPEFDNESILADGSRMAQEAGEFDTNPAGESRGNEGADRATESKGQDQSRVSSKGTKSPGQEGFNLSGLTESESKAKAEKDAANVTKAAEKKKLADQKAKADEEVGSFNLTGSDREADVAAANGQQDLLAAPAESKESTEEKKPAKKSVKVKGAEKEAALKERFTPGNIIYNGYWNSHDKVISFNWNDGNWSVKVQEVKKEDGEWVAIGAVREHSTAPESRDKVVEQAKKDPVEQAKEVLDAAGVKGVDRTSTIAAVRRGDLTPSEVAEAHAPIGDFGEKLEGAKKDLWQDYQKSMSDPLPEDAKDIVLSKFFPEPDYENLIASGIDVRAIAAIKAMRDELPNKPKRPGKLRAWGQQVEALREIANAIINKKITYEQVHSKISGLRQFAQKVELYAELGYPAFKSAKGYEISSGWTTPGKEGQQYALQSPNNRNVYFDNRADALSALKTILAVAPETTAKKVKLDLYRVTSTGDIVIGKKVASNKYIDLQTGFKTAKEARAYLNENEAALLAKLEKLKEAPVIRRSTNDPRRGSDYRLGEDVTPEKFAAEFGFRGVQFGNYVEQGRRVKDLNNAYDALLDLSNLINIPPRAISLNGTLGLAFGARGTGGVDAAAAHYEPGQIVINLTKNNGFGSLGHEWFHAMDNYFGRASKQIGFLTDATRYTEVDPANVRPEAFEAFKELVKAIRLSDYSKRSAKLDKTRSKDYWGTNLELAARAFETYIITKAEEKGESNNYLANVIGEEAHAISNEIGGVDKPYAYPTKEDQKTLNPLFDKLFETLKTKETDKGTALYSRSATTKANYDKRIDELFGKNPKTNSFKGVRVLDKSDLLDMLGYGNMPVNLSESKVIDGIYKHSLKASDWKKVPEWLDNPIAVFDSETSPGRLVFIAPEIVNGAPVRLILDPSSNHKSFDAHILINAYDAQGHNPTMRWFNNGLLRFIDNKKSQSFAETSGLRLPNKSQQMNSSDNSLLTEKNLVKYRAENKPLQTKSQQNQPLLNGHSSATLRNALNSVFNPAFMGALEDTGKFKFITNEEANQIVGNKLSSKSQEESPAFKEWFGSGKLINDDGTPKVLYHATSQDFAEFKAGGLDPTVSGHAIWLSDHPSIQPASHNTSSRKQDYRDGTHVMPLYSNIKNPLILDDEGMQDWARKVFADESLNFPELMAKGWADAVQADGYDGIVYATQDLKGNPFNEIVVFNPNNIKSAIGNNGEYDSNSNNILFSKSQEQTLAFHNWFGDSKVVDEEGNPKVMYHGTYDDFSIPKTSFGDSEFEKFGFHVGSAEQASKRIDDLNKPGTFSRVNGKNSNVMPLYIKAKNPLRLDENRSGRWGVDDILSEIMKLADKGEIDGISADSLDSFFNDQFDIESEIGLKPAPGDNEYDPDAEERFWNDSFGWNESEKSAYLKVFIQQLGYDSIVYNNEYEGGGNSYILFSPNQVKSAIGNTGAFDSSNPDIRYSQDGRALGFFNPADQTTYLIPENIPATATPAQLKGLMTHEIGVHAIQLGKDSKEFKSILRDLDLQVKSGNSAAVAANQRAKDAGASAENELEETLGYLSEDAPKSSISQRFMAWFKQMVNKALGKAGKHWVYSTSDMAAMAQDALTRAPSLIGQSNSQGLALNSNQRSTWYRSQLSDAIFQAPAKIDNSSGNNWAIWLTSNAAKFGVKKEEIEWSGVTDYLNLLGKEKVSKEQIAQFILDNGVKVDEVKLGDNSSINYQSKYAIPEVLSIIQSNQGLMEDGMYVALGNDYAAYHAVKDKFPELFEEDAEDEWENIVIDDLIPNKDQFTPVKYNKYQLPGGENYRELLITLPNTGGVKAVSASTDEHTWEVKMADGSTITFPINKANDRSEAIAYAEIKSGSTYKSSHWDTPNVLAHIRMNDRTDAEGNKVLFIEEIQSDWHQAGRKNGYNAPKALAEIKKQREMLWDEKIKYEKLAEPYTSLGKDAPSDIVDGWTRAANGLQQLDAKQNALGRAVPDAPFKDTKAWTALAIKRVIAYATENGYDKVAFVNGEQSADRYDLSKKISFLAVERKVEKSGASTGFTLEAKDHSGVSVMHQWLPDLTKLADYVGKDLAEKVKDDLANKSGNFHTYSGLDLKVGGEGMTDFYNKIVPQVANDVLKKIGGGKVEPLKLQTKDSLRGDQKFTYLPVASYPSAHSLDGGKFTVEDQDGNEMANGFANIDEAMAWSKSHDPMLMSDQLGFDITDAMRENAAKGLPLFSKAKKAETIVEESESKVIVIKTKMANFIQQPVSMLKTPLNAIGTATIPMSMGDDKAKVLATKFADAMRLARWQWSKFDDVLQKNFTKDQLEKMWIAADQENDLLRDGVADKTKGLASLTKEERDAVELLHAYGNELLQRAKDAGMYEGEGVDYWTPRTVILIDENGSITTPKPMGMKDSSGQATNLRTKSNNLKGRKHKTSAESEAAMQGLAGEGQRAEILKNIRTMPMAMARLEQAVAGRELVNQIKAIGQSTGESIVATGKQGDPEYFTLNHPALTNTKVEMKSVPVSEDEIMERNYVVDQGKVWKLTGTSGRKEMTSYTVDKEGNVTQRVPLLDENGDMITDRTPLYIRNDFKGALKAVLNERGDLDGFYNGLMSLKSKSMGLIMMSPMIHNAVEYGRALPMMLIGGSLKDSGMNLITAGIYTYRVGYVAKNDSSLMMEAISHGLVPIGHRGIGVDINGIADPASMEIGRSWTAKALGKGTDFILGKESGDKVRLGVDAAGKFWHETLLWDRIGDLQMGLYQTMKTSLLNKGVDEYTASTIAAHFANRYAGALPQESMSQGARKALNLALFSRSFTMGNLGAIKDMLKGLPSNRKAMIELKAREIAKANKKDEEKAGNDAVKQAALIGRKKAIATFVLDIALFYIANSLMQDWFRRHNGDETWQDQISGYAARTGKLKDKLLSDPLSVMLHPFDSIESLSSTSINAAGKEGRIRMGDDEYGNTIYMRLPFGKIGEEFANYTTPAGAIEMLHHKLSPFTKPIMELINNDKGVGQKVFDDKDPGFKQAGDIAINFLKAQFPGDMLDSFVNLVTGHGTPATLEQDRRKVIGPFVGITYSMAKGGDTLQTAYALDRDFQSRKMKAIPKAMDALMGGDDGKAFDILTATGMSNREANHMINNLLDPSRKETAALRKRVMKHATPEEQDKLETTRH